MTLIKAKTLAKNYAAQLEDNLCYDYSTMDEVYRKPAQAAAIEINSHTERVKGSVLTIGKHLLAMKELLPHGHFTAWCQAEFRPDQQTIQNMMHAAAVFGDNNKTASLLSDTAMYLLARPSVPEVARKEAVGLARKNKKSPTVPQIEGIIKKHRGAAGKENTQHGIQLGDHVNIVYQATRYRTNEPYPCSIEFSGKMPEAKTFVVYALVDPSTSKPFYVGMTMNFDARMKSHSMPHTFGDLWQRKIDICSTGKSIKAKILDYATSKEQAASMELNYIRKYASSIINKRTERWAPPVTIEANYTVIASPIADEKAAMIALIQATDWCEYDVAELVKIVAIIRAKTNGFHKTEAA